MKDVYAEEMITPSLELLFKALNLGKTLKVHGIHQGLIPLMGMHRWRGYLSNCGAALKDGLVLDKALAGLSFVFEGLENAEIGRGLRRRAPEESLGCAFLVDPRTVWNLVPSS